MKPALLSRLCPALVALCLWGGPPARAADDPAANPDSGKPFAEVWRIRGEVQAGKPDAPRRLQAGSTIYVGEPVRAAANGEAVFRTADAGIVAVRPNAEFVAERFAAEGKPTDRQILRLVTGSLRVISGWIARLNRPEHRIVTPSATIGIRGTDHEPYVLPAELASETYRPGTYDKVNRGATSLEAGGGNLLIDQGRVGFARDPNAAGARPRAMMTLLLPTLLARVPDFYVPGAFDAELDRYSATLDAPAPPSPATPPPPAMPAAPPAAGEPAADAAAKVTADAGCAPRRIGEHWLNRFDLAIARRDIKTILGLFAPEIVARASVRTADNGLSSVDFDRDEMVRSTLAALANLKNYQQRRPSIEASLAEGESDASCRRIALRSIVVEQGLLNDRPYRFESIEEYLLEQRDGEWLAIRAVSTQR